MMLMEQPSTEELTSTPFPPQIRIGWEIKGRYGWGNWFPENDAAWLQVLVDELRSTFGRRTHWIENCIGERVY